MAVYTIDFEPLGRREQCRDGESLLACALRCGIGISTVCGGHGICHTCRVQLLSGTASEPSSSELEAFSAPELNEGWRLACQTYPTSDCKLSIPPESMTTAQRTQVEGQAVEVEPEPAVRAYHIELAAPSLTDPEADAERLLRALKQEHQLQCDRIDIEALNVISPRLRSWNWQCQAMVRHNEVIALGPWPGRQLGLAVDLGSTKIASYLMDLSHGQTLAAQGIMNPQISYGEDIISRITYATKSPDYGPQLQRVVVEALNGVAAELCAQVSVSTEEILEAVVVGNTAMHHLLLGLSVRQLALSPFVPVVSSALDIKARDLGLHIAPGGYVHMLPNIAGFIGADHVAMLLATRAWQDGELTVALDIGTNTEVSLLNHGKITSVSCPSGPAFEGGHIKDGMRAASGAIERLLIVQDGVQYQTIDGAPAVGICGSGILDAIAQLYLVGAIDKGGRMQDGHQRIRMRNKQREFVLVSKEERGGLPNIVITQHDVREVQLAKAAIRAGIHALLDRNGCSEEEIAKVVIAGAFGSYIDVASAVTIGMLPSLPLDRFKQVGNAAGMGAKLALISLSQRAEAQTVASKVDYIELAGTPDFGQKFTQATYLGQYRIRQGKREDIN
jgi:uncharacterized 2Fe-2S/4Fe-4S cluster protein (DUF4445 family)